MPVAVEQALVAWRATPVAAVPVRAAWPATPAEVARVLVARVLAEAGIEYVFGISGGHTGRIISGLAQVQNQVRMITVREESLAGVMAEVYGRLTRKPGVMIGQGIIVLGFVMLTPYTLIRKKGSHAA